ncbi:serine/threonine-protein kinase [Amycolatopsis sp. H20-H5]|uniref:serine/threonine-protein kinase n=1 Tax=Amycolatopsis sp. H20-H5 TaxID=3046309 RepID=UPI002DB8AE3C|nr:serine/threonine-protein kinase [Amycolatopsis sp. H20-H5]MEC3982020.1 serine/threonine-protein kinase [Amycolatopsis sp. H20-H5]
MSIEGAIVGARYRLDQPIGRGRAGIVWLAFDTRLFRTVAMKKMYLPVGLPAAQAEQARAGAIQEAKDAAKVDHACAITVYDVLPDGQDVWLVMEYIPSRSMSTFLADHGRLTAEQAASLGIQLGTALGAMHASGIVHRTIEPGTVLLADDGSVRITDIGITGGGPSPAYRAPEVARGGQAMTASDVYSLGATLYSAVEGVPPFGEDGDSSERPPQNAGVLTGALQKMLRADPVTRPTMNDTVRSLGAITEGRQTAFIPPTAPAMPTVPASLPVPMPPQGQQVHPQQYQAQTQQLQQRPPMQQQPRQPTARYTPPPSQPVTKSPSPETRKRLITAAAVLAAILIGILIAELFFV